MESDITNGVLDLGGKEGRLVQKQLFLRLTKRRVEIGAAEKEVYGNSEDNQN